MSRVFINFVLLKEFPIVRRVRRRLRGRAPGRARRKFGIQNTHLICCDCRRDGRRESSPRGPHLRKRRRRRRARGTFATPSIGMENVSAMRAGARSPRVLLRKADTAFSPPGVRHAGRRRCPAKPVGSASPADARDAGSVSRQRRIAPSGRRRVRDARGLRGGSRAPARNCWTGSGRTGM